MTCRPHPPTAHPGHGGAHPTACGVPWSDHHTRTTRTANLAKFGPWTETRTSTEVMNFIKGQGQLSNLPRIADESTHDNGASTEALSQEQGYVSMLYGRLDKLREYASTRLAD